MAVGPHDGVVLLDHEPSIAGAGGDVLDEGSEAHGAGCQIGPVATRGVVDRDARALLDRDENTIATLYAVPGLILFPGQSLVVDSLDTTREFFARSWGQYEGVTQAQPDSQVVAATDHSVWVKVDWAYGGEVREHFVYQLVRRGDSAWQIAVLTPIENWPVMPRQ